MTFILYLSETKLNHQPVIICRSIEDTIVLEPSAGTLERLPAASTGDLKAPRHGGLGRLLPDCRLQPVIGGSSYFYTNRRIRQHPSFFLSLSLSHLEAWMNLEPKRKDSKHHVHLKYLEIMSTALPSMDSNLQTGREPQLQEPAQQQSHGSQAHGTGGDPGNSADFEGVLKILRDAKNNWLVVWNMFYFPIYWE